MKEPSDPILTHQGIDTNLCGSPQFVKSGKSRVKLIPTPEMAADETGLIHGGFLFGLADYAAMIAVNHPHVVLGTSTVKFLKPVRVHDELIADAKETQDIGKKKMVTVTVSRGDETVFTGEFTCFVLDKHVLDPT
jgi:acyl-coenzyme A thioesterase PaaI-like protein